MSKIEVNEIDAQSGSTITVGSACKSVAVPGNVVKTNAVQASDAGNIISQSGTTITIGASGDTVSLASGASQSGFGRGGSVDWQTTIKTGDFTAVSGEGYFVNTTSGAITMTLPASPSVGDIVAFKDYAGTFQTNNLTINRNGSNIVGGTDDAIINVEGQSVILVYGDATQGWQSVEAATNADLPRPSFICASVSGSGNTLSTAPDCANMKVATFTGPGTFTVNSISSTAENNVVSHVIVAGGGGGGGGYQSGGGGAGGYREVISPTSPYSGSPLNGYPTAPNRVTVTAQGYPITIGGGGAGGGAASPPTSGNRGSNGTNSSFGGITSAGGGSAGSFTDGANIPQEVGGPGGSGGGAGRSPATNAGGTGNTPPVSPSQGTNGGLTQPPYSPPFNGGGGGGAVGGGGPGQASCFGVGGSGTASSITGSAVTRSGGGGSGGQGPASTGSTPGGGGNGASAPGNQAAQNGTANTGGGGGGGNIDSGIPTSAGGTGGSGIVVIRYRFQ